MVRTKKTSELKQSRSSSLPNTLSASVSRLTATTTSPIKRRTNVSRTPAHAPKKVTRSFTATGDVINACSVARKKRRLHPGTKALREIRYFQSTHHMLIRRAPFARLVREILLAFSSKYRIFRFQSNALLALQEATEAFIVRLMEDGNTATIHAGRVTLMPKDLELVRRLRASCGEM